jgi:hypothetical protein
MTRVLSKSLAKISQSMMTRIYLLLPIEGPVIHMALQVRGYILQHIYGNLP